MASSDRRRAGSASQHTARSGASSRSASSSIIAPPPRAQLGSHPNTSSPSLGADGGNDNDAGSIKDSASIKEKDLKEKETTAALLRDKDEKIAELGRKMAELEADFARQVERLSQSESETASFWKSKHSSLHQQFLRTDTELRLLRAEVEVREGESEELKEGWVYLKREIQERDDEIRRLRADLMGLKKWLSTNTRTEEQESDDLFGSDMTRLGNGLQEWAIQHFRRAKLGKTAELPIPISSVPMSPGTDCRASQGTHVQAFFSPHTAYNHGDASLDGWCDRADLTIDVSGASEAVIEELSQLVPMYQELIKSAKLPLLQSIVSTILVQMIFGAYFVGLSKEQEQQFRRTEESLASLSKSYRIAGLYGRSPAE